MQRFQVAILTHFATEIPFESTTEELLTQLFVDAGVTLHTSVVVEELEYEVGEKRVLDPKRLVLVDHNGYKKECVESTAGFDGQNAEVVIALCHGSKRGGHKTVYGRRVNSFVLVCSLSSHRHLFIPLIFGSRFIDS